MLVITPVLPGRLSGWPLTPIVRATRLMSGWTASSATWPSSTFPRPGKSETRHPLTAFADALRDFDADHILIALRGPEHAGWQERGLLDRIRAFGIPMTVFEIQGGGAGSGSA